METSNKLTGKQLSLWTSSVVDTPANHLAPQENDEAQTTHDTYGLGYEMPLAHYDPDTRFWKTSGDISLWGEQPSLESLPKSGMTRNGVLYQQPDWVRPIDVIASSLWPTPTAVTRPMEGRAMRAGNGGKLNPMWVEWLMGFPIGWTDLED
jgi:hypothetical protein